MNICTKFIKILICFCLVYTPFFANAGAAEKWEILENYYDKSKNTVNVTAKKMTQQAANSGVYKVQVPVSASDLGNTLKRMLWAGVAVSAVTALVEGVGWIIENGQILKRKDMEDPGGCASCKLIWANKFATPDEACKSISSDLADRFDGYAVTYLGYVNYKIYSDGSAEAYCKIRVGAGSTPGLTHIVGIPNPNYDPTYKPILVPVSDQELGNETLGKGTEPNSRTTPDNELITSAYSPNNPVSDAPAPKSANNALNKANSQPETEPKGESETEKEKDDEGKETGKETSKFELPNFCGWAPAVCDFFTVQKEANEDIIENQNKDLEQSKTFFESVKDWFYWTQDEPELSTNDTKVHIDPPAVPEINNNYLQWNAYCPFSAKSDEISLNGETSALSSDLTSWCTMASEIKPFVLLAGALASLMIVSGVGLGRSED